MNHTRKVLTIAVVPALLLLGGCASMTPTQRGAAIGAAAGGVVGHAVTGGSTLGTAAGAAAGGAIGYEVQRRRR